MASWEWPVKLRSLRIVVLILAIWPTAVMGQIYLAPDAAERIGTLTPEQVREGLARMEAYEQRSDMGQCRPMDGEQSRFAASQSLPEMEISLGAVVPDLAAHFPVYFQRESAEETIYVTSQMMRLAIDLGGETIHMTTGGMHNVITRMNSTYESRQVYSLAAYDQQCALPLGVAIARAVALEAQLQRAGFTAMEDRPRLFAVEEFGRSPRRELALSNWDQAQGQLAVTPRIFSSVSSIWVRGQEQARVVLYNWGAAPDPEGVALIGPDAERSVFERDDTGRKFGVELSLSHLTMLEDDLAAHSNQVETKP